MMHKKNPKNITALGRPGLSSPKLVYESHFNSVEARRGRVKKTGILCAFRIRAKVSLKRRKSQRRQGASFLIVSDKKEMPLSLVRGTGKTFTFLKLFGELKERYFNE